MNRNEILLTCVKGMFLFEDNFDLVTPEHAEWICERLFWHKIMPIAAAISDPEKSKCAAMEEIFQKVLLQNKLREEHYFRQVSILFERLADASIDFIPYKGPFWGNRIYPEYFWRHIGDIDLLMTRDDARALSATLQKEGYIPDIVGKSEADDFEIRGELTLFPGPLLKKHFPVQLHWELLPSPRFIKTRYLLPPDFFVDTTREDWRGVAFRLPKPEVQFLYHAMHATCQHQFLRFAHVLIMAHFLLKTSHLNWNELYLLSERRNALGPLYYALKFIDAFSPLPEDALHLMKNIKISPRVRTTASVLTPNSILFATQKKGKFRRKLFRAAMSWK